MIFVFKPYSALFAAGIILSLVLAIITWRRRPAPGATAFSLFSLAIFWWSCFWLLEIGSTELAHKIVFAKLEYVGILTFMPLWLIFVMAYTGRPLKPRMWVLISIIPFLTLGVVMTNELHGWFWSDIYFLSKPLGRVTIWEHGFWFAISVGYQYLMLAGGLHHLWSNKPCNPKTYRRQAAALTVGALFPVVVNLIYISRHSSLEGLDFTPLSIAISSLVYVLAIYRFHLLDISAAARNTLVEKAPDGVLAVNPDGTVMDLNPAITRIRGLERAALRGRRLAEVWPEMDKIRRSLSADAQMELTPAESGTRCDLDISLTFIRNQNHEPAGQLMIMRDITERRQTRRRLEELLQKEKQLTADLQQEIANRAKYTRAMAHELKTPLTAILSSSELLEEVSKGEFLDAVVKNIRQASLRLEHRTNDLIDLARGEIGLLKVVTEPLDMTALVQTLCVEMEPEARKKGLRLVCETTALPLVKGDPHRLRAVLFNLISNALKYTERGSVTIRAQDHDTQTLLVQVSDTGKGILPEQLKDLFDPYRRQSTGGLSYSGIGIGLALCRVYIELHAGKIWVESEPGRGTTFSFTLPLYQEARLQCPDSP